LNINNAKHEITAVRPQQYPIGSMKEVAFVGRSNVGKSSTINGLLNRKNLARVGGTPGKTKELNFFNVDDSIYLVDLPGYGYASVAKEQKLIWQEVVEVYLMSRKQLRFIVFLLDIRHRPSVDDITMYRWLSESQFPHIVVAGKADKITKNAINERLKEIRQVLNVPEDDKVLAFSAESRLGRDELWSAIKENISIDND
jgi:GTP-binding protein